MASDDFLEITYDKFLFRAKKDLLYHPEESWAKKEGTLIMVGVTDYLQRVIGDLVFLKLPEKGSEVEPNGYAGTMETIKSTIDIISPLGGTIKEVNEALEENPQLVNTDPYAEGWLFKVAPNNWESDMQKLMDAVTYFPKMEEKIKTEMAKK